ncbi:MAG: ATP-dependent Clp protease adaptor ClpS [Treponema sp.]|nr:ATP-dependent Clp protease adaptor ClpS [Treponema sp.]
MADFEKTESGEVSAGLVDEEAFSLPPNGQVVFYNDDYTTKDFVVDVLVSVFHKSEADASNIMESVHQNGSAVVGVYSYDIAATRAAVVKQRAREQGFPLRVEVQKV